MTDRMCALSVALVAGGVGASATAALPLEMIALTGVEGLEGPSVEAGTTFTSLGAPIVGAVGGVAFFAGVDGGAGFNGVWRHDGAFNEVAVRENDPSPFDGAPMSFLLNNPNVGMRAAVVQSFDEAVVADDAGVESLAHTSEPAADTGAGVFYGEIGNVLASSDNEFAFLTNLSGAVTVADSSAAYFGTPVALSLLARGGDVAPDTGGDTFLFMNALSLASDGGLGLLASTTGGSTAIWTGTPGALTRHTGVGDTAPDMPAGSSFSSLLSYSAGDDAGTLVIRGVASGPSLNNSNNEGVWTGSPGSLQLAFREGDQVPTLPAGVRYGPQTVENYPPLVNSSGEIAVITRLGGAVDFTNWQALVTGTPGAMSVVARTGDLAPDSGGDVFSNITGYALSNSGHIAFIALTTDGAATTIGMYAWHPTTGLILVARKGDTVTSDGGGVYTIDSSSFRGAGFSGSGFSTGLGHDGTLAFRANFSEGGEGVLAAALPGAGNPFDLTGDGVVDGADLGLLLGAWGPCAGCPEDLNGDGVVDGADLGILLGAWGP